MASFDGLADGYERHRPRYPDALMRALARMAPERAPLDVVDLGAGTGIATRQLAAALGEGHHITAVDLSEDMARVGAERSPGVDWRVEPAEAYLDRCGPLDLALLAQAAQWMDRPVVFARARERLRPGGLLAVVQNDRDVGSSVFLDRYEALIEALSPGYRRDYRAFDYAAELAAVFRGDGELRGELSVRWTRALSQEDFVGFARSSTQVQRAIAARGPAFEAGLTALLRESFGDGLAEVPYVARAFFACRATEAR